MKFSVIVTTSPGRETHLLYCLTMLSRQTFNDFEVLVMDDGSAEGARVCQLFAGDLKLSYHYRPNDRCVSRSRNLGARAASTSKLVYLDVDLLLNPKALQAYAAYFQEPQQRIIYGYVGYHQDYIAPSRWFPEVQVNFLDVRFHRYYRHRIEAVKGLAKAPHWYALGANLALPRELWEEIGGFNEAYDTWGQEDLEFAYALLQAGYQIHFSLDAWGEHQYHARSGSYHDQTQRKRVYKMDPLKLSYDVHILASKSIGKDLLQPLFSHCIPRCKKLSDTQQQKLQHPEACLSFQDQYSTAVAHQHVRPSDTQKVDFVILGGRNCGAELLMQELCLHSKVSGPHRAQALHFFDRDEHFTRLERWYHDQFPNLPRHLRGETTPSYLYGPDVALRMRHYNPQLKLIVLLREPGQRAWAEYLTQNPQSSEKEFKKVLQKGWEGPARNLLQNGYYAKYLHSFMQHFSGEQILLLDYEQYCQRRQHSLHKVLVHLGLWPPQSEPLILPEFEPLPPLQSETKTWLQELYQPPNQELKDLLNPLDWLNPPTSKGDA